MEILQTIILQKLIHQVENNSSSNGSSGTVNNEIHDNSAYRHYEHRNEFKKPSDKSIVTNRSFNRKKDIPKTGVETDSP